MGEALKAWVLKQTAKAPVAPALKAWANFPAGVKWTGTGAYLDQVTPGGCGYYPPTSQPAPGYSSTATSMVLTPAQLLWKK